MDVPLEGVVRTFTTLRRRNKLNEKLKTVQLTTEDWNYIANQLIPFDTDQEDEVERKFNLSEQIQYQIGNRSPDSHKLNNQPRP